MNDQQLAAVKQALGALKKGTGWMEHGEIITALQSIISQDALDKKADNARELGLDYESAPVQEPWKPSDTANRIGGLPQDFIEHKVENEGDWSEWVNPDSEQYFMKCCDCGLVHEMQFKVVKYSEGDECEFIDDADLQAVFRARRATPPAAQKQWVGLSEEEVEAYDDWADFQVGCGRQTLFYMVRNIEAKLKEKNHD
jgi:hypothetical protein